MDIELFALKIDRELTLQEQEKMLAILPPRRRERLEKLSRDKIPAEPLCAYALLLRILHALYGWNVLPQMAYNQYGKPFFPDYPDVHFNISHTRGALLVGVHNQPLGVDLELIRPVSARTMEMIAGVSQEKEFFENWVRRESRGKWGGIGLGSIRKDDKEVLYGENFYYVDTFPEYVACVCTHSADRPSEVRCLTLR